MSPIQIYLPGVAGKSEIRNPKFTMEKVLEFLIPHS